MKGLVFAIEEMAVHDGPGLRTAVFLKGCPLRCQWCHNPEGWVMKPQRVKNPNLCEHCGACETPCMTRCTGCGSCLWRCPKGLLRISGTWWESADLARRILANRELLREGGVTLSGGEVLMQADFAIELLDELAPLAWAVETSGYGDGGKWREILRRLELVYYDVKLADGEKHRRYCGQDNAPILGNLETLKRSGVPFIVRVPTVAGVHDDAENMRATCRLLEGCPSCRGVELLPYNAYAGSKYALVGMTYAHDDFRAPDREVLERDRRIFEDAGIPATIR